MTKCGIDALAFLFEIGGVSVLEIESFVFLEESGLHRLWENTSCTLMYTVLKWKINSVKTDKKSSKLGYFFFIWRPYMAGFWSWHINLVLKNFFSIEFHLIFKKILLACLLIILCFFYLFINTFAAKASGLGRRCDFIYWSVNALWYINCKSILVPYLSKEILHGLQKTLVFKKESLN